MLSTGLAAVSTPRRRAKVTRNRSFFDLLSASILHPLWQFLQADSRLKGALDIREVKNQAGEGKSGRRAEGSNEGGRSKGNPSFSSSSSPSLFPLKAHPCSELRAYDLFCWDPPRDTIILLQSPTGIRLSRSLPFPSSPSSSSFAELLPPSSPSSQNEVIPQPASTASNPPVGPYF